MALTVNILCLPSCPPVCQMSSTTAAHTGALGRSKCTSTFLLMQPRAMIGNGDFTCEQAGLAVELRICVRKIIDTSLARETG